MITQLRKYWDDKPLLLVLLAGALVRLLAVLFSKGYGFFDDHFLIIEPSQSWADGSDANNWLPGSGAAHPGGHNLFYTGLHYCFFLACKFLHFNHPQGKMYVVRFLHAAFSLLIITLGYKITFRYADKHTARMAAILLSLYWFMPTLSVRNLVEIVCIPFLLFTTWMFLRAGDKQKNRFYLYAGLAAGCAFSIRFQSLFFLPGFGMVLLLQRRWTGAALFALGALLFACLTQGLIDYAVWHRPFAEFREYVKYNLSNAETYGSLPWYTYFFTLGGILLPPVSIFLLFGFARKWKSNLLLFLPAFLFFAFHSYFPNKQERFILPVIPFVIIGGMTGWHEFVSASSFWKKHTLLLKRCWLFFWILNSMPLLFLSVSYAKRDRVESMTYLYHKADVKTIIIEASNEEVGIQPPLYYLGKWPSHYYTITSKMSCERIHRFICDNPDKPEPNYVIFQEEEQIDQRVRHFKECYGDIVYETTIHQGLLDEILHFLNPVNKSQTCFIYKIVKKK
ncbi:MAG: glycosyltransferase family 39 protein [Bacteroidia bacterium]